MSGAAPEARQPVPGMAGHGGAGLSGRARLALVMSADLDEGVLRGHLADRIAELTAQSVRLAHQRERAWPDQTVADDLVAEHARLRVEAELSWHRLVLDHVGKLAADSRDRAAGEARRS